MHPSIRPELAKRIVWETKAVEMKFPGRFRLRIDDEGQPSWEGTVPVEGQSIPVIVTYPAAYPGAAPLLQTEVQLPPHCPHLLERRDGRSTLCWIAPGASKQRRRWDPQRHTAATVMRVAQRWFIAYLVWQTLGRWPVPDAWEVDGL